MFSYHLIEDPALKKFVRAVGAKDALFQQGETANSLFVLIEGRIALYQTHQKTTRFIDIVSKGEILGEKTLTVGTPMKRTFTAEAITDVLVLELNGLVLKSLMKKMPEFAVQVLRDVDRRLDKAFELVSVLQVKDDAERTMHYLQYWAHHNGTKGIQGIEFELKVEEISNMINVPPATIEEVFRVAALNKVFTRTGDQFLVADEGALVAAIPSLKTLMAA